MEPTQRLSDDERTRLAGYETTIERGLGTFVEVGRALLAVLDEGLYVERYGTFEAYTRDRWGISYTHASRLIKAAEVVRTLPIGKVPPPSTETQARELAPVPEAERPAVWREAVERTGGKPTAAAVREVREERAAPTPPPWTLPDPVMTIEERRAAERRDANVKRYAATARAIHHLRFVSDGWLSEFDPADFPHDQDVVDALDRVEQMEAARDGLDRLIAWRKDNGR